MVNVSATPPTGPQGPRGPEGPKGAAGVGGGENITRTIAGMLKILASLLAGINKSVLPELRYSQKIAEMFGAVFGIMTKGSYPATTYKNKPGVQVANQKTMSNFLKAWLYFLAAEGKGKPAGVSSSMWSEAKKLVKEHPPTKGMLANIAKILKNKGFQNLFKDVLDNAGIFKVWSELAKDQANMFKGKARKKYDDLQAKIQDAEQQEFETDPKMRGPIEKKIEKFKAELQDFAKKNLSPAQLGKFNSLTSQMQVKYKERLAVMERVVNKDVPEIQKGRTPKQGTKAKMPTPAEQNAYNQMVDAGQQLSSNADAVLNKWKVMATYYAKTITKLAPLISKFLKAIQSIEQLVRDKTQA